MNRYLFLIITIAASFISCKKESNRLPPVTPPPSQVEEILLKDIVVPNLPSPYYHFEYNDLGFVSHASFASGLMLYDISYASRRINEMKSIHFINKDRLLYQYENDKVVLIRYINEAGVNYKRCFISYNLAGRLTQMEWEIKLPDVGFALERTVNFTYYPDGNLLERKDQRHAINGRQNAATYLDRFEDYENKVNTDGFMLVHDNNDHLILLPRVKFQKNNPQKNVRTGDGLNYEITYTFTYNNLNRPIEKKGNAVFTSGPNAGQHFQTRAFFTYYP